jgi:hypothetical protein
VKVPARKNGHCRNQLQVGAQNSGLVSDSQKNTAPQRGIFITCGKLFSELKNGV